MKRFLLTLTFLVLSAGMVFAASNLKSRGDQDVYGTFTFHKSQEFRGDIQVDGSIEGVLNATRGEVYYVHSGTGSDTPPAYGDTKDKPFATIDYAIGQCTANRGDVILVLQGHSENLDTAGETIDVDVDGISIIGLGSGESIMPEVIMSLDSTYVNISADDVTIENMWFKVGISGMTCAIDLEDKSSGVNILGCVFSGETNGTAFEFDNVIVAGESCNFLNIEGNIFDLGLNASVSAILLKEDSKFITIKNNDFWGDASTALVNNITAACTYLKIEDNNMTNGLGPDLNTEPCVELVATTTGLVHGNMLAAEVTSTTVVVGDDMIMGENFYNEVEAGTKAAGLAGESNNDL